MEDTNQDPRMPENTLEVILTCDDGREYVYWVDLTDLPSGEEEYDWAIEKARGFHKRMNLPVCPQDSEDENYGSAHEPFPRKEGEFTWVR